MSRTSVEVSDVYEQGERMSVGEAVDMAFAVVAMVARVGHQLTEAMQVRAARCAELCRRIGSHNDIQTQVLANMSDCASSAADTPYRACCRQGWCSTTPPRPLTFLTCGISSQCLRRS